MLTATIKLVLLATTLLAPAEPEVRVSRETTYLTEPLAADGLPDYRQWLLDKQREGVTPENNAAVPLIEAMWPAIVDEADREVVCRELGMPVPRGTALYDPSADINQSESVQRLLIQKLLARRGVRPSSAINSKANYEAWQIEVATQLGDPTMDPFSAEHERASWMTSACQEAPWPSRRLPELVDWIDRNESGFALLMQAAGRSHFYLPDASQLAPADSPDELIGVSGLTTIRMANQCLAIKALYKLEQGAPEEAWSTCKTMYALALSYSEHFLVDHLVKIALVRMTDELAQHVLASPDLSRELAFEMRDYYAKQPPRHHFASTIEGERVFGMLLAMDFIGARTSSDNWFDLADTIGGSNYGELRKIRVDPNTFLVELNRWYDRSDVALRAESYVEMQAALAALHRDLDEVALSIDELKQTKDLTVVSQGVARAFATAGFVDPATAYDAEARHNSTLSLVKTAAALALYRVDHQDYPDTLAALVPEYMPALLSDDFRKVPLAYTKTDRGYLLSAAGVNGQHEQGMSKVAEIYKGYSLEYYDQSQRNISALCELLGEPLPAGERGPRNEMGEPTQSPNLLERIPKDSDDLSIRMPPVPPDWDALLK